MKILPTLYKNARAPQNEKNVPFVELLPLALRNYVSGKSAKGTEVACLQEMAVLLACMKTNEFTELPCSKEISSFKGCFKEFRDKQIEKKNMKGKTGVIATGKDLDSRQLNQFMRRFPNL